MHFDVELEIFHITMKYCGVGESIRAGIRTKKQNLFIPKAVEK